MTSPVYQWQPTSRAVADRFGLPVAAVVRFDHNTSPFGTGWAAVEATRLAARLNEYPAADYAPLRAAAAAYAGTSPDRVAVGAGADELIGLAAAAFLRPGGTAVAAPPTYALYAVATARRHAALHTVDRRGPDFALPVREVATAAANADLVWLCVPHNPTGDRPDDDAVASIITAAGGVVVLDAAYAEFAGDSWTDWIDRHPDLIVLHTLSKAFGLAGIRTGYALGSPERIAALDRVRPPGSISTISAGLARIALEDPGRAQATVAAIGAERDRLAGRLDALGLRVLPSMTNFLLCEVGAGAARLAADLMAEGLVVRTFRPGGPLDGYLRFTVRSPEDDDRLLAVGQPVDMIAIAHQALADAATQFFIVFYEQ